MTDLAPIKEDKVLQSQPVKAETESPVFPSAQDVVEPTTSPPIYDLRVDPNQNDRAVEIRLCSSKRPHMRAFHSAWVSFFTAFFLWFSVSPLLGEIADTLNLSYEDVFVSTMCSDISTLLVRVFVGPLCDTFGARIPMAVVLIAASIPTALTGTAQSLAGLCVLRFCIGIAGSTFVMAQSWTSRLFCKEIIGSANAIVAGWGNLGGGVAQLVMGAILFPLLEEATGSTEKAWRTVFVIPAVFGLIVGATVVCISDDAPQGYFSEMKLRGQMDIKPPSFQSTHTQRNAYLLAILYACSFGVEIAWNNAGSLYFQSEFGQSTESAAALSAIFGITNLFARALGGLSSDWMSRRMGMRGRLALAATVIFLQGASILIFASCDSVASSIPVLVVVALLVNATEGAIFGIVPYVNPPVTGYVSGIVGSGGNLGGLLFAVSLFKWSFKTTFVIMGVAAMASSAICWMVHVPGHSTLAGGKEHAYAEQQVRQTTQESEETDEEA